MRSFPWIPFIIITLALLVWLFYVPKEIPQPWRVVSVILPVGLYCYYLLRLAGVA